MHIHTHILTGTRPTVKQEASNSSHSNSWNPAYDWQSILICRGWKCHSSSQRARKNKHKTVSTQLRKLELGWWLRVSKIGRLCFGFKGGLGQLSSCACFCRGLEVKHTTHERKCSVHVCEAGCALYTHSSGIWTAQPTISAKKERNSITCSSIHHTQSTLKEQREIVRQKWVDALEKGRKTRGWVMRPALNGSSGLVENWWRCLCKRCMVELRCHSLHWLTAFMDTPTGETKGQFGLFVQTGCHFDYQTQTEWAKTSLMVEERPLLHKQSDVKHPQMILKGRGAKTFPYKGPKNIIKIKKHYI